MQVLRLVPSCLMEGSRPQCRLTWPMNINIRHNNHDLSHKFVHVEQGRDHGRF